MTMQTTLEQIARQHLGLATLTTQNADGLDFHEHAVWTVDAALKAAFRVGQNAAAMVAGQTAEPPAAVTGARAAYMAHQGEIEQLLVDLGEHLKSHAVRAAGQPDNYGFAGDLGRVETLLNELVDGLAGRG